MSWTGLQYGLRPRGQQLKIRSRITREGALQNKKRDSEINARRSERIDGARLKMLLKPGYCGGGVLELEVFDEVELFTLPCFFFVLVVDSVVVLRSAPSG
jgi:hypothetical protein